MPATAVKRLVDFNFDVAHYPVLTVSNLRARSFDQVLDLLARLSQTGVLAPYPELAQYVTRELGLPQSQEPGLRGQASGSAGQAAGG